jgi:hypothetical protein
MYICMENPEGTDENHLVHTDLKDVGGCPSE